MSRRGHTLLEMVLAASMLGVLMTAILVVYVVGAGAWRKGDAQADLMQELQVAGAHLQADLEQSSYPGLSVGPGALACLSAFDDDGNYTLPAGSTTLRWKRFRVYWLDAASQTLRRRTVDLSAGSDLTATPAPIDSYVPSAGGSPLPLVTYQTGGDVIARQITGFSATLASDGPVVRILLTAEKRRYGRQDPEKLSRTLLVRVNN